MSVAKHTLNNMGVVDGYLLQVQVIPLDPERPGYWESVRIIDPCLFEKLEEEGAVDKLKDALVFFLSCSAHDFAKQIRGDQE